MCDQSEDVCQSIWMVYLLADKIPAASTVSQGCFPRQLWGLQGPFVVESRDVMDEPPPPRLLLEGLAICPDLVWSGNISTSPLCRTETDIQPLKASVAVATIRMHRARLCQSTASHAANGGDVEMSGWPGRRRQGMC
ncbi:unnamed protein product [Pleuronectes platessa]|uniref:Uncharacterized protein n=1 Tax=Pleuronectes platessa TaxID=8262 RepID=A0A9N7ZFW7_PLEPL|nr:unnamed protein product [Pleuronectes platessa]